MEEDRVDGSSRAVLMKKAEKSTGNGELEISLKKLLDQSERAVLASEDTDRLSTEVPPDEEYLKLFQEEKNVRKCIILLLAK